MEKSPLLEPALRTKIMDWNLESYGLSVEQAMENVGKGAAREVERKFGKKKRIGVFCGLGNNGGDGFVAARYLCEKNRVTVYLLGEPSKIRTAEARKNWEKLAGIKGVETVIARDAGEIPEKFEGFDIILDCLLGVGVKGEAREPIKSCVVALNRSKGKKIAVDVSTPLFKADLVISAQFPKERNALAVNIGVSDEMEEKIGPGSVKALYSPPEDSHKGQNGILLIIAGSDQYHGSAVLAAKAASRFCDLIYFASTNANNELVKKMKLGLAEVIVIDRRKVDEFAEKSDCILIGPGIGTGADAKKLVNGLLKKFGEKMGDRGKKFVLDADALKLIDKKLLNGNCLLTPHAGEFAVLFGIKGDEKEIVKQADKFGGCTILLKGAKADLISDGEVLRKNFTGNEGMTKGGTGDVLAGLCGALACKNPPVLAACAAAYLNGAAGDLCFREMDTAYNAGDVVEKLGEAFKRAKK